MEITSVSAAGSLFSLLNQQTRNSANSEEDYSSLIGNNSSATTTTAKASSRVTQSSKSNDTEESDESSEYDDLDLNKDGVVDEQEMAIAYGYNLGSGLNSPTSTEDFLQLVGMTS